jgi:4-cresol dehydrogenase (hydroxylating)
MQLVRMDRIIEYNDELGYVTIEPGVTQRMLCEFLHQQGDKYWMDATGASQHCSIIGNTVERGCGHSPYGDHFAYACGFEVVLPDGECIQTGLGRYANATATPVYRWGVGPYIDGLFTQSNLGIVTRMTVWLMPKPDCFQAYLFSVDHDEQLESIVNALRPLRLNQTIKSALHIGNDYRILSSIQQYPWREAKGKTPLPPELLSQFSKKWDFGAWSGMGALYGTRTQVAEARKILRRALRGKVKVLRFVSERGLRLAERFQRPLQRITGRDIPRMLKMLRPVYNMLKGIPTDEMMASAYWRKRTAPPDPATPEKDGCGLIWTSALAPINGRHARTLADIAKKTVLEHGFEPGMTLTLLTERCMENIISVAYDRDVPGEDERAMACYRELIDRLSEHGYYPYRHGTHSLPEPFQVHPATQQFLQQLRTSIDPHGVLAPGRYI